LVVHLNQGDAAATKENMEKGQKAIATEQQRLQRDLLKQKGLKPIVEPLDYGGGFNTTGLKNRSTTFGAWNFKKKEWEFYTHLYSRSGMTYTHAGLKKV
jgi:predicted xylose isomerase-like sugar epimerase